MTNEADRLARQIEFIIEIDRLKTVYRNSYLIPDPERKENSAEHSWHTAVMAMVLAEYAVSGVDTVRVIKMMLIHDIVEIDAGDVLIYHTKGAADREEKEKRAAERIFGLLPQDQKKEFIDLWDEFENKITPEAKFAGALDRLMPLLHNYTNKGKTWREHGIYYDQVLDKHRPIEKCSPRLWEYARSLIDKSVEMGYLKTRSAD
jgi:putative hydrolases of HD superfamily